MSLEAYLKEVAAFNHVATTDMKQWAEPQVLMNWINQTQPNIAKLLKIIEALREGHKQIAADPDAEATQGLFASRERARLALALADKIAKGD